MQLQQLRKAKFSILASISHIFQNLLLTEPHTYLYNELYKSHGFLISCFESGNILQKSGFLEKFILSFFFEQDLYENKIISDFEIITNLFNTFFSSHCTTLLMIVYTFSNPLSDFATINYL